METLLAKYGRITPLRPEEETSFRGLAMTRRECPTGTLLVAGDFDEPDQLFVVESGRLFASSELSNGERAITRLYFAGDIVGTANIPFEIATQSITVHRDAVIYLFPRQRLIDAFRYTPRVAAIFYTFAALENAILNDRLVSIGRTRGKARLAGLILEIAARLNLTRPQFEREFVLGLTQSQIGDAIGLTEVQVNRLIRSFYEERLVRRSGETIKILDLQRLREMSHFHDRYDDLDLNWFKDDFQAN
ncbi:Crp/Fnr family transcriptional regulator [Erythrobacter sp.]|jgi:CRP-like cAMP-binding protein|uniref:Crp/Fnr family transcriptional regulator n=1 Tax=Erythrobacter sp. TaxID=1042 RepID=UPI002EA221F9|nr:Crp/Fnr family transcriptional regulator [Erythrobacter sp.]